MNLQIITTTKARIVLAIVGSFIGLGIGEIVGAIFH